MALVSRAGGMLAKRMRLYVNGLLIGNAVSGIDFEAAKTEVTRQIYGDTNGVQIVAYAPGPQSVDIMENPNMSLVNEILAGFPARNLAAPVIARAGASVPYLFATVETLNSFMTGYSNGSSYLGYWAATLGGAKGDPGAEAVRTLSGQADVPMTVLRGGQFLERRISLSHNVGEEQWEGVWNTPSPLTLLDLDSVYAVYLEIQAGTGRTRTTAAVMVDDSNVASSGSGGSITIPDQDVEDAGFEDEVTLDAWVIFVHDKTTLQDHDCRYPAD